MSVVVSESSFASINNALRRLLRFPLKNIRDNDGVGVNPVNDSPDLILVNDPQLMTASSDRRHRPGMRHAYGVAAL
jgi:hypothetical protein